MNPMQQRVEGGMGREASRMGSEGGDEGGEQGRTIWINPAE